MRKILISVLGGIAEIVSKVPEDVDIEIRDFDDQSSENPPDFSPEEIEEANNSWGNPTPRLPENVLYEGKEPEDSVNNDPSYKESEMDEDLIDNIPEHF